MGIKETPQGNPATAAKPAAGTAKPNVGPAKPGQQTIKK